MATIWDMIILQNKEYKEGKNDENSIFIVGSKDAGKTTMLLRFLDRDDVAKPTVALEYTFGRRSRGHNFGKDVGHMWELGGGTWLKNLMDIPLSPENMMNITLILFLDLSKPYQLWTTMETCIMAAKARISNILDHDKQNGKILKDKLLKKAWERVGDDNQDKNLIDVFLIPLVIVGGKYDIFQDFESEERKIISKTLRFVSHTYGATLCYFSSKNEQLISKTRSVINSCLFGSPLAKSVQADNSKALFIPAGLDSMQSIGSPPLTEGDIGRISARTPMELWKHAYTSYFKQQDGVDMSSLDDPGKDPQYAEPAIDKLRQLKNQELERYRKLCEKKSAETLNYDVD